MESNPYYPFLSWAVLLFTLWAKWANRRDTTFNEILVILKFEKDSTMVLDLSIKGYNVLEQ